MEIICERRQVKTKTEHACCDNHNEEVDIMVQFTNEYTACFGLYYYRFTCE